MAFDPSVIGNIPDSAPNPVGAMSQGFKLADLVNTEQLDKLRLNQIKTEQDEAMQMKEVLKKQDLSTPQGITKAAQALTSAGLPQQGMKLMSTAQEYQTGQVEQERAKLQLASQQADILAGALDNVYGQLEQFRTTNPKLATPEMLDLMAARIAGPAMKALKQQYPELSQYIDKFGQNPQNLTYAGIKSAEAATNRGQAMLKERLGEQKQELAERKEAFAEKKAAQQAGSEKDLETNAQAIAKYQEAPPTLSSRNPRGYQVMARVMEINPDYDANQYKTTGAAEKAFATGKQGDTVRSLNVAVQHLNQLSALGKDLKNTDSRAVNSFFNAVGKQFGRTNVTNFETAKSIVGDEVVKAVVGSGAGSLADREDLQSKFDAAATPEQLMGVIKTAKGLMTGQLKGLKQQYESSTGKKDFESKLSPETKTELEGEGETQTYQGKTYRLKPGTDRTKKENWEVVSGG